MNADGMNRSKSSNLKRAALIALGLGASVSLHGCVFISGGGGCGWNGGGHWRGGGGRRCDTIELRTPVHETKTAIAAGSESHGATVPQS